jgi:N-acetyl sugar amidotransferase
MKRCLRCVMPDTRPDTAFVDGVCSACIAYAKRPAIDWQTRREQLGTLLARMREHARSARNDYHCIVPSSGGKDSTYQVLTLMQLGLRPLVVTASTCHLTPIGRANIDNLARHATTIEVTPNRAVRAKLNRLGLTMVGDISWPEHVSIFTAPFKLAARLGIPFLFYGENPQNQYGGPSEDSQGALTMTRRWVSEFGGFLGLRPRDLVGVEGLTEADMADYMPPSITAGAYDAIEAHFLGQYLPWDSHRNAALAAAAGMRQEKPSPANWWAHENLDNAQTGLHDHGMFRKYGYGRGCAQISVDVRAWRVARDAALAWVLEHDGLFPQVYAGVPYGDALGRIGLGPEAFRSALDRFTNWELFQGTLSGRPILKDHPIPCPEFPA